MLTFIKAAGACAAVAVTATFGLGSAAAQSGDFNALPVDPNLLTDSLAYSAAPFIINPNGQQGVEAQYTHREGGTRSITTSILLYPNEQAALASLSAAADGVGNPRRVQAPVGANGTLVAGTGANGGSTTVLTFTQGNVATTIEFDGPANDPAPDEFVIDLGQKQDTAILDWQGV
jgi:hypothetical protein